MRARHALSLCAALLAGACTSSQAPSTGRTPHPLPEHGLSVELPDHFGRPTSTGGAYEWTANGGLTTLRVAGGGPVSAVMPGQTVDYERDARFGPWAGREQRTQERLGNRRRITWTGNAKGPRGPIELKLIMLQAEPPEEFGESFWQNLRGWLRAR
jgi:hypothetical protein